MTALMIILGILLFFVILLVCPVTILASFETELSAKVRYLFITYTIAPQKEKKEKKAKKEEPKTEEKTDTKAKIKGIIEQKGLSGFLNMIKEMAAIATGAAKKLFVHLIISSISADIDVATEDAAQTALNYGYACAVVYPAMAVLVGNSNCKKYDIKVTPNFDKKECEIHFSVKAGVKLFFIISAGLSAFFNFLKVMKNAKTAEEN